MVARDGDGTEVGLFNDLMVAFTQENLGPRFPAREPTEGFGWRRLGEVVLIRHTRPGMYAADGPSRGERGLA